MDTEQENRLRAEGADVERMLVVAHLNAWLSKISHEGCFETVREIRDELERNEHRKE